MAARSMFGAPSSLSAMTGLCARWAQLEVDVRGSVNYVRC